MALRWLFPIAYWRVKKSTTPLYRVMLPYVKMLPAAAQQRSVRSTFLVLHRRSPGCFAHHETSNKSVKDWKPLRITSSTFISCIYQKNSMSSLLLELYQRFILNKLKISTTHVMVNEHIIGKGGCFLIPVG